MFIDIQFLEKHGACSQGLQDFQERFPGGADSEKILAALDTKIDKLHGLLKCRSHKGYDFYKYRGYRSWLFCKIYTEQSIQKLRLEDGGTLRIRSWEDMAAEFGIDNEGRIFNNKAERYILDELECLFGLEFDISDVVGGRYILNEPECPFGLEFDISDVVDGLSSQDNNILSLYYGEIHGDDGTYSWNIFSEPVRFNIQNIFVIYPWMLERVDERAGEIVCS